MSKSINILDKDYTQWVKALGKRYRQSQIKAAVKINGEMLRFYWELGRDIAEKQADNRYGSGFYAALSRDLRRELSDAEGLSETAIRYAKRFYCLYFQTPGTFPQLGEELEENKTPPQLGEDSGDSSRVPQQVARKLREDIFSVPWGHHKVLIDKCSTDVRKALFYVRQTVENGWSRAMLLNVLDTNLYERQGKAMTNFNDTLPAEDSDLAREITRDPYCFGFTKLRAPYNERQLKEALIANIETFLLELGTGFAYMGREYRLVVGQAEQFMDMLFYNVRLRCYVVVEVKTAKFESAHIGQLGGYMVAVDHQLCKPGDNKTIGLLICKSKDRIEAQYALEASNQPIGVSEYELEKFYPEKLEGTIPTIEEIEARLSETE